MQLSSSATRLVFAIVAPTLLVGGMLVGVGAGCSREELAPVGASSSSGESLLAAALTPSPAAHLAPTMTQYAKEARISPLGARTLANTAGLLPGRTSANSIGSTGGLDPFLAAIAPGGPLANNGLCPPDMASIDDRFCVDRYEASLLEVLPDGTEAAFSPYESVKGHVVRAVSEPGVFPQGYISEIEATTACAVSGKRLCKAKEWRQACMGPEHKRYGYADKSHQGACNDHGRSPVTALYSDVNLGRRDTWDWERMNNPQLNQLEGTLAHTGEHSECTNDYGVYDMVGNLHEWVDDPKGTFQGGYYQDTTMNGEGCQYVTMAHEARYHDYSTGFRCCSDVAP